MIECEHCGTAQFLQITRSRVYFEEGEQLHEVDERYECTLCGATGRYASSEDGDGRTDPEPTVSGGVTLTRTEPEYA